MKRKELSPFRTKNPTALYHGKALYLLLLLVLLFSPLLSNAGQESFKNTIWVWAEDANEQHAIFLGRYDGEKWEEPLQLSNNTAYNVTPSITRNPDNDLWVVWTSFEGQQSRLMYKRYVDGEWSAEQTYVTGLSANTAPSIGIEDSGKIWLIWVGFDGFNDEIYYSTWNGSSFAEPSPITQNNVPDILPVLGINSETQTVWVQWKQFRENGYVNYQTSWTGSEWSSPESVEMESPGNQEQGPSATAGDMFTEKIQLINGNGSNPAFAVSPTSQNNNDGARLELALPSFMSSQDSAALHIPGNEIQSFPMREMEIIP